MPNFNQTTGKFFLKQCNYFSKKILFAVTANVNVFCKEWNLKPVSLNMAVHLATLHFKTICPENMSKGRNWYLFLFSFYLYLKIIFQKIQKIVGLNIMFYIYSLV